MRFWHFDNMKLFQCFVIMDNSLYWFQVLSATEGYCKDFSLKIQDLKLKFTLEILAKFLRNTCDKIDIKTFSEIFHRYCKNLLKCRTFRPRLAFLLKTTSHKCFQGFCKDCTFPLFVFLKFGDRYFHGTSQTLLLHICQSFLDREYNLRKHI